MSFETLVLEETDIFKLNPDLTQWNRNGKSGEPFQVPGTELLKDSVKQVYTSLEKKGIRSDALFQSPALHFIGVNSQPKGILGHTVFIPKDNILEIYIYAREQGKDYRQQILRSVYHEFAHVVRAVYMNDQAFEEYKRIREIPPYWGDGDSWNKQPDEIFAEDFKQIFFPSGMKALNKGFLGPLNTHKAAEIKKLIIHSIKKNN